jgi:P-type E1-E2 ATPase
LLDIEVSQIQIGERLVVFPYEVCPADGVVLEGRGSMDESYLTGEPFLIQKAPGVIVLSGALNGETVLTISVSSSPSDSRYAKIIRVMREAEANRPQMRRIADRLGAWYTVLALGVAGIGWVLAGDPTRFLAVLVIATPCPLLLAIPVAIIGAISVAASRGVIVKDPSMLERIDRCRTFIFDKTGTLTYGRPALTDVICAPGESRERVLRMAASLEQYSKHPLATAISEAAKGRNITRASYGNRRKARRGAQRNHRRQAHTDHKPKEGRGLQSSACFQASAPNLRPGVRFAGGWRLCGHAALP